MLRLLGPLIPYLAVVGATAVPVAFVAHNNGYASAKKDSRAEVRMAWSREILLYSTISDLNERSSDMAAQFGAIIDGTDEARRSFRASLQTYQHEAEEGRAAARRALELLDHMQEQDEWAPWVVSPDAVCVRGYRAGCDNADDASGSDNGDELREQTPTDGS